MQEDIINKLGEVATYDEQMEALVRQMANQFDATDFMPPSHRVIAQMPQEQLMAEYELVLAKESTRSAAQRRMIVERVESIKAASDNV
jgi:hypothetical protein